MHKRTAQETSKSVGCGTCLLSRAA